MSAFYFQEMGDIMSPKISVTSKYLSSDNGLVFEHKVEKITKELHTKKYQRKRKCEKKQKRTKHRHTVSIRVNLLVRRWLFHGAPPQNERKQYGHTYKKSSHTNVIHLHLMKKKPRPMCEFCNTSLILKKYLFLIAHT
ncbi:hypothetical protein QTP88_024847 [Uroleucon formosanum]